MAAEITGASMPPIAATEPEDAAASAGTGHHYWVQARDATERLDLGAPTPIFTHTSDADGNGLIDIATPQQPHNIRFDLTGAGYRTSADGLASALGCPEGGCLGYELTADISFDS